MKKYLFYLVCIPFSFFTFLIIILIKPIFKIRLAKVDFGRIGETYPIDWYISEKKNNVETFFDIFFISNSTKNLNNTLYDLFKKKVFLSKLYYFWNLVFIFIKFFNYSDLIIPTHGLNYT